jgi:hypothetical protein
MIRFLLHPPGLPAWKLEICRCHWSDTRHPQVQAQWCLLFYVLIFPPPARAGAGLSAQPAAAAAVSRRSSGGFAPFRPWQLAVPASGSVIWTTTLSELNRHLKVDARGRPLAPSILRMPSYSTGAVMVLPWSRMHIGDIDVIDVTVRIFHSMRSHCVLWIDWFNSIVFQPTNYSSKVHWEPSVRMTMPNETVHLSLRIPPTGL